MSTSILRKRRQFRITPQLELMEDRVVPSTFTVTNTLDNGVGSLRQAVALSNMTAGPNTINFAATARGTISLTSGELLVTNNNLRVNGPGASQLVVSGSNASRIFDAQNVNLRIDNLGMSNGYASQGAAVYEVGGTLALNNDTIANNHSTAAEGGAVYATIATVNVNSTTFINNVADWNGGAIFNADHSTLNVASSVFLNNSAGTGGGAIFNWTPTSTANIANSSFFGNSTAAGGGGALYSGSGHMSITNSALTSNHSDVGGAIYAGGLTTVNNTTMQFNHANLVGGAIAAPSNTVVSNSTIQFNTAGVDGGGISFEPGFLSLIADTINNNSPNDVNPHHFN